MSDEKTRKHPVYKGESGQHPKVLEMHAKQDSIDENTMAKLAAVTQELSNFIDSVPPPPESVARWEVGVPDNRGLYRGAWFAALASTSEVAAEIVAVLNGARPTPVPPRG